MRPTLPALLLLGACQPAQDLHSTPTTPTVSGTGATPTGTPGGTANTPPELVVGPLSFTENPGNVLSVWVAWTTEIAVPSVLQYGPPGAPQWEVSDPVPKTEHSLFAIGMRAETEYSFAALADNGVYTGSETALWTSGLPPPPVVPGILSVSDPALVQPGWTLMDLYVKGGEAPTTVALFDEQGQPVWYYQFADALGGQGVDLDLTPEGTLAVGGAIPVGSQPREIDLAGNELWRGGVQPGFDSEGYTHHHFQKLPSGNYLTLEKVFVAGTRGDMVVERAPDGTLVWSWNTFDWLPPEWVEEWTHCNWVNVTEDLGWLSVKLEHEIVHFDRNTGEVIWELGADRDFTLVGAPGWFRGQHSPSILPNGNVLVYDNQGGLSSRVVEYALDLNAMTATQVWSWDGGPGATWEQGAWGDADRLANGNTLVTSGRTPNNWIREVTPGGVVVWDLLLDGADAYRSERVEPPLVRRLP